MSLEAYLVWNALGGSIVGSKSDKHLRDLMENVAYIRICTKELNVHIDLGLKQTSYFI
jgi:hypothetical protein